MGLHRSKNITAARRTADKWFGRYIRVRDCDADTHQITCITCHNKYGFHENKVDCGHWIGKDIEATRYNEWNANGQCKACNITDNGRAAFHGKEIAAKFGKDVYEELLELAQKDVTLSIEETMEIAREYKQMAEDLAEQKGVEL